jgi:hypothetical protein
MVTRMLLARGWLLALAFALCVLVAGCGGSGSVGGRELGATTRFDRFPLYWVGPRFEKWNLTAIDGLAYPSHYITLVYGTCRPNGGDEPSCSPPLQIQVSRLCYGLDAVTRSSIWKRRLARGAPVGVVDSAPVLLTERAQVRVYTGAGASRGTALRVLRALRSLNDVPPLARQGERIPAARTAVLSGRRPCH